MLKIRQRKNNCNYIRNIRFIIQERPVHTRTWNLKATLGPKPCRINQRYRHTNVNQHVFAEEVPNNINKKESNSLLRNQLSDHIQPIGSPQYFFKIIFKKNQAQFTA